MQKFGSISVLIGLPPIAISKAIYTTIALFGIVEGEES